MAVPLDACFVFILCVFNLNVLIEYVLSLCECLKLACVSKELVENNEESDYSQVKFSCEVESGHHCVVAAVVCAVSKTLIAIY